MFTFGCCLCGRNGRHDIQAKQTVIISFVRRKVDLSCYILFVTVSILLGVVIVSVVLLFVVVSIMLHVSVMFQFSISS